MANPLPFSEAEYVQLTQLFEKFDTQADGQLSWTEISEMGTSIGKKIDQALFKKIDKDRSGFADWGEVVRCFYPAATSRDVNKAIKMWGAPHQKAKAQAKTSEVDWRRKYDAKALEELTSIYELYCGVTNNGQLGSLTRDALRQSIPRSSIPDNIIDEVFAAHDLDRDNMLSLEEFASIMEDTYLLQGDRRPEVRLYFQ